MQYANGTTSETDKEAIEAEATQLKEEIKRVGETTTFNGVKLLEGGATITFQVGANEKESIAVKTLELEKATEKASRERNQNGRRSARQSHQGGR